MRAQSNPGVEAAMHGWAYRMCCEFGRMVDNLPSISEDDRRKAENRLREIIDEIPFKPSEDVEIAHIKPHAKRRAV